MKKSKFSDSEIQEASNHSNKNRLIKNYVIKPETQMMGYGFDPALSEGALKPPIFMTSTFVFKNAQHGKEFFELAYGKRDPEPGEKSGLIYNSLTKYVAGHSGVVAGAAGADRSLWVVQP